MGLCGDSEAVPGAKSFGERAGLMLDRETRAQYGRLADAYEQLADNEEDVARNMGRAAE